MGDFSAIPEPAEGTAGLTTVIIRFSNDEPVRRRFLKAETKMSDIFAFAEFVSLREKKFPSLPPHQVLVTLGGGGDGYSLLKQGWPKEKISKKNGRIFLKEQDVTDDSLVQRDFKKQETMILHIG